TVRTRVRQPSGDGGVLMPKHPHGGCDREPFGQGGEHFGNPMGAGFEPIEWRSATRAESRPTCLAAQGLDSFTLPVCAVTDQGTDQGMDVCVDDLIVGA